MKTEGNLTDFQNRTDFGGKPKEPFSELYWIFSQLVLSIVIIFSLYLLVCLSRYATITKCSPGREISGKKGRMLYRLCLVSLVMAVARFVSDEAVAITGWTNDKNCVTTVSVSAVFYSLSLYPIYIFLWMRQSIFYANPVLSHVLNPVVTFISWATLVVMLSGGAVLTVIYILPEITGWRYEATDSGCRDAADVSGFDLVTCLVVAFTVSFQVSLLALFMYPLLTKKTQRYRSQSTRAARANTNAENASASYEENSVPEKNSDEVSSSEPKRGVSEEDHSKVAVSYVGKPPSRGGYFNTKSVFYRKTQKKDGGDKTKKGIFRLSHVSTTSFTDLMKKPKSPSNASTSEGAKKSKRGKTQQGRRIIQFMRKAFFLTLFCVMSDVIFAVIQMVVIVPELVYLVLFDVNLLINIVCIVMSFRDWPRMIAPVCARHLIQDKNQSRDSNPNARSTRTMVSRLAAANTRLTSQRRPNLSSSSEATGNALP
ncbi:uncharacterized protein LOC100178440 isoform X1 [Ciona intestinalis]